MILFAGALLGILLLPYISIQLHPSPRSRQLTVTYQYPGASPEVIEQEVASRLESTLATMRGLQSIRSVSDIGRGRVSLQFDRSADIEKKRMEVAMLIRQVYPRLEAAVSYPQITYESEFEAYETLLIYTLSSPLPPPSLKAVVQEKIIPELSREPGVHDIELSGLPEEEYRITIRDRLRQSLGIAIADIQSAIRERFTPRELGLATINEGGRESIRAVRFGTSGVIEAPEKLLGGIPLARRTGRIIFLHELADIERVERRATHFFRINGQTAISMSIYAGQDVNQIRLAGKLREKIAGLETGLQGKLHFKLVRDETEFLRDLLEKIGRRTGATMLLLLLFLLLVRPHWRYLLLIGLSLSATLLLAVIAYYLLGLELHLYSIAGWTLSLGIILDNLIVMSDHIRHQGDQRIFPVILAATLTTVGALSVVFFIDARYRESLSDFSGVFTVNLLISLLVALFFIPALYRTLFPAEKQHLFSIRRKRRVIRFNRGYRKFIQFSGRYRKTALTLLILLFGIPIFLLPEAWEAEHVAARWYNQTIGSDTYRRDLAPRLEKYLGGTFRLFHLEQDQFHFQPEEPEQTRLFLRAKMPYGGTVEQLNEIIRSIELQLSGYREIDQYQSRVSGPDQALIEITFKKEFESGNFPYVLKSRLETIAVETGSADFGVYGVGLGFSNEMRGGRLSIQIQLLGYNYEQLWQLARTSKDFFLQHLRIQKAYINAERTYYEPDETYFLVQLPAVAELQQSALAPARIGSLLRESQFEKGIAAHLRADQQTYPVQLYTDVRERSQLWDLKHEPYRLDSNQLYKHASYLELEEEKGQQKIVRTDQQYQLILAYEFIGNYELSRRVMEQKLDTLNRGLPLGYSIGQYGRDRYWDSGKSRAQMVEIITIALVVIFLITAVLFNSLRQAFTPLLLILPGFIGIFLSVYFFDFRFDQGGFAAFLLVAGLSVNAGLLLINDFNNNRKRYPGRDAVSCFLKAFNSKIIAILLTALSTILGLVPFILFDVNQAFWYALALCTIGGMIFSTLAVYLFFPVLFLRSKQTVISVKPELP